MHGLLGVNSLLKGAQFKRLGGGPQLGYMFAGTRFHVPPNSRVVSIVDNPTDDQTIADSPAVCFELITGMPTAAWSNPRLYFPNYYRHTTNGDTYASTAKVITGATVYWSGVQYTITFGGSSTYTIPQGVHGVWCDAIPISGAGGVLRIRTADQQTVGTTTIRGYPNRGASTTEGFYRGKADGLSAAARLSFSSYPTLAIKSTGNGYGPSAMIVQGLTEAMLIIGDSLMDGLNQLDYNSSGADSRGRKGFMEFGLDGTDQGSRQLTYWKYTLPSSTCASITTATKGIERTQEMMNAVVAFSGNLPFTRIINNMGTNDAQPEGSLTGWKNTMLAANNKIQTAWPSIPITHAMLPMRNTGTYTALSTEFWQGNYQWTTNANNGWALWIWLKDTLMDGTINSYLDLVPWLDGFDNVIQPPDTTTESPIRGKFNPYFTDSVLGAMGVLFSDGLHPGGSTQADAVKNAKYIGRNAVAYAKVNGII